jgi:hypothetical protein
MISVVKTWTDNEFEQTWHVDEDGQLICSHKNIEREPGQHSADPLEQSWSAYDVCTDCGETFEIDSEPDDN